MRDAPAALRRIGKARAFWVSRGDDSGTHKKENALWQKSGFVPAGVWYRSLGQGMGGTLRAADEMRAYTLSDRGSYLFFAARGKVDLRVFVEGDKALINPYGVIAVNPKRHPHVRYDLAMKYVRFLTSPEGQRLIGGYFVSQVSALLYLLGVGNGDLPIRVLNGFHHGFQRVNPHLSGVGVKLHRDVLARRGIVFLEGGCQGHLDGLKHLLSGQVTFSSQLGQRYQKVAFHGDAP